MDELDEPTLAAESSSIPKSKPWIKTESAVLLADLLAGGIVIALIFWWLQYATDAICCGDYDGYYHIKWARLLWDNMRAGHFPPAFPWLPLTTLNPHDYVDHHLLYHIILIPFTWFRDLQKGAKVSAIIFTRFAHRRIAARTDRQSLFPAPPFPVLRTRARQDHCGRLCYQGGAGMVPV